MQQACPDTKATYDLVIIGAGPAGYTAAIYASRYNLKCIIIGAQIGGQTAEAHLIQNFPSYEEINGFDLIEKFRKHAESYGVPVVYDTVEAINGNFCDFDITTNGGSMVKTQTILLATGQKRRKLKDEERLFGKGLTYCTTCDGPLYKGKVVAVVGGSDAANMSSLYLVDIAKKVYQIYRGSKLRGEPTWYQKVQANPKIEVLYETNIIEFLGNDHVDGVKLDKPYKGSDTLKLDGVFVEIGSEPDTTLSGQLGVKLNEGGFIIVEGNQSTSVKGVWAAGDITTASDNFHQIITAASEGAVAAHSIFTALQAR